MAKSIFQREVQRIDEPPITRGMTPVHRVRLLVAPDNFEATDPFLLLAEDWFPEGVFDDHPHRGIETVTYVLEGQVDHYDNHGNRGSILAGDAQWMTAGRGIIHCERPAPGTSVHTLQLWVNLPAKNKMTEPRYQDLQHETMPARREPGAEIRVFSGTSGEITAPTQNHVPVTMVELLLESSARVTQDLPGDYNAFMVVLDGEGFIGTGKKTQVRAGQVVWLTNNERVQCSEVHVSTAEHPLRALLYAGRPLHEPVVARGPFVMNTKEEIVQAYRDFQAGKF